MSQWCRNASISLLQQSCCEEPDTACCAVDMLAAIQHVLLYDNCCCSLLNSMLLAKQRLVPQNTTHALNAYDAACTYTAAMTFVSPNST